VLINRQDAASRLMDGQQWASQPVTRHLPRRPTPWPCDRGNT
jgi:hypothetical protein